MCVCVVSNISHIHRSASGERKEKEKEKEAEGKEELFKAIRGEMRKTRGEHKEGIW